jgi:GTP cyclohydrolase I
MLEQVETRVDFNKLQRIAHDLLVALGEDPERDGLKDTPRRWAKMWREFVEFDPGNIETSFETQSVDQLIVVSGIRVWSLCEHHLLPFYVDISIGYIPRERILGLSKFARVCQLYAHKLQVQERLVEQIANEIDSLTNSGDIAVLGRGEHLCMTMRGAKATGLMTTSVMHGKFRSEPSLRQEFLELVRPK